MNEEYNVPVLVRALALIAFALTGCQAAHPPAGTAAQRSTSECPTVPGVRAGYVGPYRGLDDAISVDDLGRDVQCGEAFKARQFPNGYVTVFGSSRIRESNDPCVAGAQCSEQLKAQYDALYAGVRRFAEQWSRRYARQFPILTGAGPGLMEAANRGAFEGGGISVGYTTYYDRAASPTPQLPYGGDPAKAFNRYVTTGAIFTSVSLREAAMVRHSAAIVFAPGGTGTQWEIYQVLEMIKSAQLRPVPVYFFGERSLWTALEARLHDLVDRRVVNADELSFIRFATGPEELVAALATDLKLDPR